MKLIEDEVQTLVNRMQGFGLRIRGQVQRNEGIRDNYTITFSVISDGDQVSVNSGTINGLALLSVNEQNRLSILQDKLARIIKVLMFESE